MSPTAPRSFPVLSAPSLALAAIATLCAGPRAQEQNWFPGGRAADVKQPAVLVGGSGPAVGDFDGDGLTDVVGAFILDGTTHLELLLQRGDLLADVREFPLADGAGGVRAADVDLDGNLDLVVLHAPADGSGTTLRSHLGAGDGTFAAPIATPIGPFDATGDRAFQLGDADGDGFTDAWLTFFGTVDSPGLAVARGLGNGSFELPVIEPFAQEPIGALITIELGDLDNDGDSDALLTPTGADAGSAYTVFAETTPGGTLTLTRSEFGVVPPGQNLPLQHAALGDIDDDGDLDALIAVRFGLATPGSYRVFWGDGSGQFSAGPSYEYPPASYEDTLFEWSYDIQLGDVDDDGLLDIVSLRGLDALAAVDIAVALGDGSGAFQEVARQRVGPSQVALADLSGDGQLDAATGAPLRTWLGRGAEGFLSGREMRPSELVGDLAPASGAELLDESVVFDADADGLQDLAFPIVNAIPGSSVALARGLPGGGFEPAEIVVTTPILLPGLQVADVDGDGVHDLLSDNSGDSAPLRLSVARGTGDGAFEASVISSFPIDATTVFGVQAGEFTGDGLDDVIVGVGAAVPSIAPRLFAGDGLGGFSPVDLLADDGLPLLGTLSRAVLDADGNGVDDVAMAINDDLFLLRSMGAGRFGLEPIALGTRIRGIRAARVDGDAHVDLVTLAAPTFNTRALHTFLGDGTGAFAGPLISSIADQTLSVHVADLDRDQRVDVIAQHSLARDVFAGVGDGTFAEARRYPGNYATSAGNTELDLDGNAYPDQLVEGQRGVLVVPNIASPWRDAGFALPSSGDESLPQLAGFGPARGGEILGATWLGAPGSAGILFAGAPDGLLPFHGGVLVPTPELLLPISDQGTQIDRLPAGFPAGIEIALQAWFVDGLGSFSASRAVSVETSAP